MTDSFRSFRRDSSARDTDPAPRNSMADPLAELARLIGQSDPQGGQDRYDGHAEAYPDAAPDSGLEWGSADEQPVEQRHEAEPEDRYSHPAESYHRHSSDHASDHTPDHASWPRDGNDAGQPPTVARYSAPGPSFANAYESRRDVRTVDTHDRDEPRPATPRSQPLPYIPPGRDPRDAYRADSHAQYDPQASAYDQDYSGEDYDEERAPRRSGTIIIVAVLGLAVLGTAGAVGYRAMFGSSVIPTLPPIIKPGNTPIKVLPNHDAQAGASGEADAANRASGDHLVTSVEQPVDVQAANAVPRVVTTIPVVSNSPDAGMPGSPPAGGGATAPTAGPSRAFADPGQSVQPFGSLDQQPPSTPAATPPAAGTKAVRTMTFRSKQPGDATPAPTTPGVAAARPAAKPSARTSKPALPEAAAGGPLSIVPTPYSATASPPPRIHTAMAPASAPTPSTLGSTEAAAAPSGAYTVQVSSQRSEAEAQAAFRSLQAKYPQQLGSRQALFRRADLGDKGIYYRALVGPFASAEQAAGLCSSLKAAGGSCIVQRN